MGKIGMLLRQGCLRLCPLMRTLYYNFLRGKTARSGRGLLLSTTYSVFDIHPTATLDVKGRCNLWIQEVSRLAVGDQPLDGCRCGVCLRKQTGRSVYLPRMRHTDIQGCTFLYGWLVHHEPLCPSCLPGRDYHR